MRRAKLEMYIDVLKVLAQHGPLKLTHIMYRANLNVSVLKDFLDFMVERNLVEVKKIGKKRVIYAITQDGLKVLQYFRELKTVIETMTPATIIRESIYAKIPREEK